MQPAELGVRLRAHGRGHPSRDVIAGGLLAALFAGVVARVLWHIGDEGSIVYNAQRWAQGDVPYRDFFEVMGPFTFAPGALAFRVFGVTWWASRIEMIATSAATAMLMCWMGARIGPDRPGILPGLMYVFAVLSLWPGVNYHADSNVGALAAAALMAGPSAGRARTALAGVVMAAVALVMIQKGVLLLAAAALVSWFEAHALRERLIRIAVTGLGFAGTILLVLGYFAAHGALSDLLYATIAWPASQYHAVNRVPPGFGYGEVVAGTLDLWRHALGQSIGIVAGLLVLVPSFAVPALAALGVLLLPVRLIRGPALTRAERAVGATGLALLVSESHRPDVIHLLYGAPLLMLLAWAWLARVRPRAWRATGQLLAVGTLALAIATSIVALSARTVTRTPVGTIRTHGEDRVLTFLSTDVARGEPVLIYPWYPMYYFVAGVKNPTRFSIFMYDINTSAQARELVSALERARVRHVLWDTTYSGANMTRWFPGYRHPPPGEQPIERYFSAKYVETARAGRFRILERLPP